MIASCSAENKDGSSGKAAAAPETPALAAQADHSAGSMHLQLIRTCVSVCLVVDRRSPYLVEFDSDWSLPRRECTPAGELRYCLLCDVHGTGKHNNEGILHLHIKYGSMSLSALAPMCKRDVYDRPVLIQRKPAAPTAELQPPTQSQLDTAIKQR